MLVTVYTICAVVGGILVVLSMFGGDHSHHDADISHDVHLDGDSIVAHDGGLDTEHTHDFSVHAHHSFVDFGLLFLSLRFWTYFAISFGVIGLVGTFFTNLAWPVILASALSVGLVTGVSMAYFVRMMMRSDTHSNTGLEDVMGLEGQVTVTIRGLEPGRIRCSVKGETLDFLAITDHESPLQPGESVIIVSVENDKARVIPREALLG